MKKQIKINEIKVIQAPLAGISDYIYRQLIRKYGSKCLLTTEMLSSEALNNVADPAILKFDENEYPLSFQIVGHKPELMAKVAKNLQNKASSIDINFGCPVNKVVKGQDGCAAMKNPKLAFDIVKAIKDSIDIPLSAKFRLGWDSNSKNYIAFAQTLQDAGVDYVTLHGRTRSQMYSGPADWEAIGELVRNVDIPVFANGDIKSVEDAINCLETTKAQGVSIGRGIMGDFTLPYRIEHYFKTGEILVEPDLNDKISMLKEHLLGEANLRGELNGIKFMRKFYSFYISKVKNASKYRQVLVTLEESAQIHGVLNDILRIHSCN